MDDLIKKFNDDMETIFPMAAKLGYKPSYFLQMLRDKGGYQAAQQLIHSKDPASGLTSLWEIGRLDLSVEAHVIKDEYKPLFSDEERDICTERLEAFGYEI